MKKNYLYPDKENRFLNEHKNINFEWRWRWLFKNKIIEIKKENHNILMV